MASPCLPVILDFLDAYPGDYRFPFNSYRLSPIYVCDQIKKRLPMCAIRITQPCHQFTKRVIRLVSEFTQIPFRRRRDTKRVTGIFLALQK